MKEKLIAMKQNLELKKAAGKKGAASIETILVSGLLVGLAIMTIIGFSSSVKESATKSNTQMSTAVGSLESEANGINTTTPGGLKK